MSPVWGRYMHYTGIPLWPFGFGLAYTRWSAALTAESAAPAATTTAELSAAYAAYYSDSGLTATPVHTLTVQVTNEGERTYSAAYVSSLPLIWLFVAIHLIVRRIRRCRRLRCSGASLRRQAVTADHRWCAVEPSEAARRVFPRRCSRTR